MGGTLPLEILVRDVELGRKRADAEVEVNGIHYDAKCYRVGAGGIIRLDLKRKDMVPAKKW